MTTVATLTAAPMLGTNLALLPFPPEYAPCRLLSDNQSPYACMILNASSISVPIPSVKEYPHGAGILHRISFPQIRNPSVPLTAPATFFV